MEGIAMCKSKPAKAMVLVIIFVAVTTIVLAATIGIIARENNYLLRQQESLQERVYDGE